MNNLIVYTHRWRIPDRYKLFSLIIALTSFFLYSCNSQLVSRYTQSNKYIESIYYSYNNDSLRLRIDLFGDYTFGNRPLYNNVIERKAIKKDNAILNRYSKKIKLSSDNFLFKASTDIPPYYHFRAYLTEPSDIELPHIIEDTGSRTLVFSISGDSLLNCVLFFNIDKKTKTQSLDGIKKEAADILNNTYRDNNYKKYEIESPFAIAKRFFDSDTSNYLSAIKVINKKKAEYYDQRTLKDMYIQAALVYNSYIENNPDYDSLINEFYQTKGEVLPIYGENSDVLEIIKEQSKERQIVIINEQHWQPKHRYLGNILLQYYYDQGFRYFAVEGVSIKDEEDLNKRKFPLQKSGFYIKEPQFGNMIRNALNIGYQVIGYDSLYSDREYMQALNIYNKCLKNKQDTKVLIWAGIGHIIEEKSDNPKMAYHLKEISGIDPLTIEQTQGDYHSAKPGKLYLGIYQNLKLTDKCDLFLYNNYKEEDFRIKPETEQIPIKIELSEHQTEKLKQHQKLLLSVFYKHEFEKYRLDCVPLINRLITNTESFYINLPAGEEFLFIIRTPTGYIIN